MTRKTIACAVLLLSLAACGEFFSTGGPGRPPAQAGASGGGEAAHRGWLHWRGPHEHGTSDETGLPDKLGEPVWTYGIAGRGSPVIADGRLYGIGYEGERAEFQEVLFCLDPETGKKHWDMRVSDFLSDVIYDRYSIGSPTVDPETGHVYWFTTLRELYCLNTSGKILWKISTPEQYGINTYPNGRTGAPSIDGDLVIVHGVSNNWGKLGPPADRFFAFDKKTGEPVWTATPGEGPPKLKDSSFSSPNFDWLGDMRVFYAGDGSGNVVCVNARTGEQVWRYPFSFGGINSSVLVHKGGVIAVHGKENLDSSGHGRLIKLDPKGRRAKDAKGSWVLDKSAIVWQLKDIVAFTSSPVLVGDRVYLTVATGELVCINADTGEELWHKKLATDQIHASPLYGDGKLYVPMNVGEVYVLKPSDTGAEVLDKVKLEGNCLGAPAAWNGKVYVHSMGKLYCFGQKRGKDTSPAWGMAKWQPDKPGKPAKLQVIPEEVLLRPGQKQAFRVRAIDANGNIASAAAIDPASLKWAKFIPPTAKVKAEMDGGFNAAGELAVKKGAKSSAGAFKATGPTGLVGVIRGRVMPNLPYTEDFESFNITVPHATDGVNFAYPPLPWSKARFSWEVRELEGNKVLAKTLDRLILQRALTYIGAPTMSNYTFQADVKTDGSRRLKSEVGLINQRYIIELKGNHRQIEINSNQERVKVSKPFDVKVGQWYTLQTRVDVNADGSGVVRAKAWPKGEAEPAAWTIEAPLKHVHTHGAPGLFGFSPQGRFRVYVDNIKITQN